MLVLCVNFCSSGLSGECMIESYTPAKSQKTLESGLIFFCDHHAAKNTVRGILFYTKIKIACERAATGSQKIVQLHRE